jgi:hypothetical protein
VKLTVSDSNMADSPSEWRNGRHARLERRTASRSACAAF